MRDERQRFELATLLHNQAVTFAPPSVRVCLGSSPSRRSVSHSLLVTRPLDRSCNGTNTHRCNAQPPPRRPPFVSSFSGLVWVRSGLDPLRGHSRLRILSAEHREKCLPPGGTCYYGHVRLAQCSVFQAPEKKKKKNCTRKNSLILQV